MQSYTLHLDSISNNPLNQIFYFTIFMNVFFSYSLILNILARSGYKYIRLYVSYNKIKNPNENHPHPTTNLS